MGLEVYYRKDILNALLAAEQSVAAKSQATGKGTPFEQGYITGYRAALTTIALAFGLIEGAAYGNGHESTQGDSFGSGEAFSLEGLY